MRFERSLITATAVIASATLAAGCGEASNANSSTKIATPNVYMLDGGGAKEINLWLKQNQGKRIVSFTGILAYREDNGGYELVIEPGNNSTERCEDIGAQDTDIQDWINTHPDRSLIGIASVPAYSGGVEANVVCSDAKAQ